MSNLLDKASIILTPTAYNNGEALCVKPSDGSGDFDFSRNSAATRVNTQGLVENVQILSSNLVQNGDFSEEGAEEVSNGSFSQEGAELVTNGSFDTDTDWSKSGSVTIGNGKANFDIVSGGFTRISQNISLTNGKTYKINLEVNTQDAGKQIFIRDTSSGDLGGLQQLINLVDGVTSYTYYFTANANSNAVYIKRQTASGDYSFSIDNCSVREVGQDWVLETGWSIGEDKAISDGSGSIPNTDLIQGNVFTSGKSYKVTLEIKDYVSGNLQLQNNTTNFPQSNGIHTIYSSTGSTSLILRSLSFIGSVTNISVKEVLQDWTAISNSVLSIDNGALKISNVTQGYGKAGQSFSTISGKTYKIKFDGFVGTSGQFQYRLGTTEAGTNIIIQAYSTNQTIEAQFTAISSLTYLTFVTQTAATGVYTNIDNVSVIEITDDTSLPRINYEGFSYQDALGSELVTNGDFLISGTPSANTYSLGWYSNTANVSITNGTLILTNSALENSSRAYITDGVSSTSVLTTNKSYKLQYEIVANNGVSNLNYIVGSVAYAAPTTIGTHIIYFESGSSAVFQFRNRTTNSNIVFDNVSVKEYLGQEVVPGSGCGSWLWEPQTTQLVPYSEDFSQWNNAGDVTIESGYLAPDGTNNAYKVSGSDWITLPASLLTTSTRSIYARTVSGTGTANLCSHNSNTNNLFTITDQWQRFDVTTSNSTGASSFYAVDFRGGTTLSEIIIWGANATNDQDYVTSYIPSNGSQVTRNQDLCTNGGSLASINSTEGTLYAEIAALANDLTQRQISIDDGTGTNRIILRYNNVSNNINAYLFSGSVQGGELNFIASDITQFNKIAFSYKQNEFKLFVNGTQRAIDTSGNTFSPNTINDLSFDFNGGFPFFGKTKALAVWKEALSDSELQSLTTI